MKKKQEPEPFLSLKTRRGNMDKPYLYIWNFKVPAENEVEFQKKYGPEGDWVELFRKAEG